MPAVQVLLGQVRSDQLVMIRAGRHHETAAPGHADIDQPHQLLNPLPGDPRALQAQATKPGEDRCSSPLPE